MIIHRSNYDINPLVSIIIPVYNTAPFIVECLNSLVQQTYKNIEVICVDDGSTDGSLKILQDYADKDKRIIVLRQENQGAAIARNYGMEFARGEYLLFLDSDDVFDKTLVEKAVKKAEEFIADIVVYKGMSFSGNNRKNVTLNNNFKEFSCYKKKVFSVFDVPDVILNAFMVQAWNKLFRRDFIEKNKIVFQNLKRTNDLLFTSIAILKAERIILIDEVLVYYRTGREGSLQSSNDKTPLEFYEALVELKNYLVDVDLYALVHKSFLKLALDVIFYNINSVKIEAARDVIINRLRGEGFYLLGISKYKELKRLSFMSYLQYKCVLCSNNIKWFSVLYAVHKIYQYYRLTGVKNTLEKIIVNVLRKW